MHGGQETPATRNSGSMKSAAPARMRFTAVLSAVSRSRMITGSAATRRWIVFKQRQQLRFRQSGADHQTPSLQRQGNRAMGGIDRRGIVR